MNSASQKVGNPICPKCLTSHPVTWNCEMVFPETRANRPADDGLVARLEEWLERIQEGDRPLPWVVHSGCSYRRIASEPTPESGFRSFPDGNVLHAYNQRSDGHPDLSMGEKQLSALVEIVNSLPTILTALRAQSDAEVEREAWRPIETAPKDGTPIILFARARNATAQIPVIGWWIDGEWIEQAFSPNVPVKLADATAWMPRPEFPRGEHRKDGT